MNQINTKNDRDVVDMSSELPYLQGNGKEPEKVESHAKLMKFIFLQTEHINHCKKNADKLWTQCLLTYKSFVINTYGILNKKEYDIFVAHFDVAIAHLEKGLHSLIDKSKLSTPHQDGQIRVFSIVQPISDNIKKSIDAFKRQSALMKKEVFLFGTQRI